MRRMLPRGFVKIKDVIITSDLKRRLADIITAAIEAAVHQPSKEPEATCVMQDVWIVQWDSGSGAPSSDEMIVFATIAGAKDWIVDHLFGDDMTAVGFVAVETWTGERDFRLDQFGMSIFAWKERVRNIGES